MRKRYRYDKNLGKCVEIVKAPRSSAGPFLMPDINAIYSEGGIVSPINGEFITSRSQLRAHEQRYGVKQCGELTAQQQIEPIKRSYEQSRAEMANMEGIDFSWTD